MSNPWFQILIKPRQTIAEIVKKNPDHRIWWLAFIYGFSSILSSFQSTSMGIQISLPLIFLLAIIIAPFWGYICFTIWSWVITFTGKWLKGQGGFKEVRCAYAWSNVPIVINIFLWFLLAFLFGDALFTNYSGTAAFTQTQITSLLIIFILRISAAVWGLVIYLNALAEVQKFSVLRAIGNVILSAVIIG